uniref:Protein kinase domain-containing protein n=1 Tax=Oryza punctata TaxID=4537 RepID=A0A0E0MI01_ORYPU
MSEAAAAVWGGLGQAATVAQLAGVDPLGLIVKVIKVARKARNNKEECEKLARRVNVVRDVLLDLQQHKALVTPAVLDELNHALLEAHHVIQSFEERCAIYQFVMASRQEERLRGVQSKIHDALNLFPAVNTTLISRLLSTNNVLQLPHLREVADDQEVEIHGEGGEKFTAEELVAATNNYGFEIGTSNSGTVYKGTLADEREVAIKVVCDNYSMEYFEVEASILLWIKHKHIIRLFGTLTVMDKGTSSSSSTDDEEGVVCRMQIFQYMNNGSLADHIHGDSPSPVTESWKMRIGILLGVARAVRYLHYRPTIIHRSISSSNILLDDDYSPRLSGFGLSLILDDDEAERTDVHIHGNTLGYIDPEYENTGRVTPASDVYSFGIVTLEVLTGWSANLQQVQDERGAVHGVQTRQLVDAVLDARKLKKVLDSRPATTGTQRRKALHSVAETAASCLQLEVADRPTMSEVVVSLKEALKLLCEDE